MRGEEEGHGPGPKPGGKDAKPVEIQVNCRVARGHQCAVAGTRCFVSPEALERKKSGGSSASSRRRRTSTSTNTKTNRSLSSWRTRTPYRFVAYR